MKLKKSKLTCNEIEDYVDDKTRGLHPRKIVKVFKKQSKIISCDENSDSDDVYYRLNTISFKESFTRLQKNYCEDR